MGKTYSIRKVGGGRGVKWDSEKKNECWSLFHIPPPPCMPESKLPSDSYLKSDVPSIQELGSHIVGARVRTMNQGNIFCGC